MHALDILGDPVRRRILDQWRQGRSDRVGRRGFLLDAVLLLVAAAALANLRASGTRQATGGYDVLATLAPGLAVLAAAGYSAEEVEALAESCAAKGPDATQRGEPFLA